MCRTLSIVVSAIDREAESLRLSFTMELERREREEKKAVQEQPADFNGGAVWT
jgi:hypothetical protein